MLANVMRRFGSSFLFQVPGVQKKRSVGYAKDHTDPLRAIDFALYVLDDLLESDEFLRCWSNGEWQRIEKLWPQYFYY